MHACRFSQEGSSHERRYSASVPLFFCLVFASLSCRFVSVFMHHRLQRGRGAVDGCVGINTGERCSVHGEERSAVAVLMYPVASGSFVLTPRQRCCRHCCKCCSTNFHFFCGVKQRKNRDDDSHLSALYRAPVSTLCGEAKILQPDHRYGCGPWLSAGLGWAAAVPKRRAVTDVFVPAYCASCPQLNK